MAASSSEPPAVARQQVRRALRQARQATPMSQGDVAKKLTWSLSKVQRIEGGEVALSVTDLKALLELYGITDPERVARLSEAAVTARRQRWFVPAEHREHLPLPLRELMQFELKATAIRAYQPVLIPGVLQTPAVVERVLGWRNRKSAEQRRVYFDVRRDRRRQILDNPDGPELMVVLDESVMKRPIGGAAIMAEQLDALVEVARHPRVRIRVVPFERGALAGLADAFQIVNLSGDEDDGVVYRESYDSDRIMHDPEAVVDFRRLFEELWEISLPESDTIAAISAEADRFRSSLDKA